jgi:hypothetical protein
MSNTLRALDFFASLHLTILERPADFEFFNSQLTQGWGAGQEEEWAWLASAKAGRPERESANGAKGWTFFLNAACCHP